MTQIPCCCSYSPFSSSSSIRTQTRYLRRLPGPGFAENNNRLVLFDVCDEFIFGRVNRKFLALSLNHFSKTFCFVLFFNHIGHHPRLPIGLYKKLEEREKRVHSKDDLNSLRYSYHFLLGFSQHLLLRDEIIDVPSLFVHLMNVDDDEEESKIKSQIMRIL